MDRISPSCRFLTLLLLLAFALTLTTSSPAEAAGCTSLCNATQWRPDLWTPGARVYIEARSPDLRGGDLSYHRVAVIKYGPFRFAEIGWITTATGFWCNYTAYGCALYSYGGDNLQTITGSYYLGQNPQPHFYSLQYANGYYYFYIDDTYTGISVPVDWSYGRPMAGGETGMGRESMGYTPVRDLRYLNGSGQFASWNGYTPYVINLPYWNRYIDSNSFYDADAMLFLPNISK